jgi:hypothetical protein
VKEWAQSGFCGFLDAEDKLCSCKIDFLKSKSDLLAGLAPFSAVVALMVAREITRLEDQT